MEPAFGEHENAAELEILLRSTRQWQRRLGECVDGGDQQADAGRFVVAEHRPEHQPGPTTAITVIHEEAIYRLKDMHIPSKPEASEGWA